MPAPVRSLRVLVVDDCPDTVASCAELLRLFGHGVRTALGGAEALALLGGWEPDAALIDLRMPGMDGFELARRLREPPGRATLLLAVTGLPAWAYAPRAEAAGFDHFLAKPVNPDVLLDLLHAHAARLAPGRE